MGVAAGAMAPSLISAGGAILGGLLSNKGTKSGNTTSTTTNVPWSQAQPHLTNAYQHALWNMNQGLADSPALQQQFRARALAGSPVNSAAQNLATSTMRGDYLNSNPFATGAVQDAMNMARSQINNQFGLNNYGSSAHQEWLGRGLMNASLPYLSQNYENERGRQYAAMAQAPSLASTDYQDLNALQQASMIPWSFIGNYSNIINGIPSAAQSSTQQTPYFTNPLSGALGGAMLANQLYQGYQPQMAQELVPGQFSLSNPAYG